MSKEGLQGAEEVSFEEVWGEARISHGKGPQMEVCLVSLPSGEASVGGVEGVQHSAPVGERTGGQVCVQPWRPL